MSEANTISTQPPAVVLNRLSKTYGQAHVVDDINLTIQRGEFLTLLGPSGSGKTTTLKMIAGFINPSVGNIQLNGRDITTLPPEKRDIGMVFQNYALFPHMTAAKNIAFPLEMRRTPNAQIHQRVADVLALVQLEGLGSRYPRQLSGGQQQRVAVARAVVFHPQLLLMDEPLGALDKKLREELQVEIMAIRRRLDVTVMYVTHDQEEALAMSDRIAIFNRGRIEQIGTAADLYEHPATVFVAGFMGESTILSGHYERDSAGSWLVGASFRCRVDDAGAQAAGLLPRAPAALVIRPERMRIGGAADSGDESVQATITEIRYLGASWKYDLRLPDGTPAVVREVSGATGPDLHIGDQVRLGWKTESAVLLPTHS